MLMVLGVVSVVPRIALQYHDPYLRTSDASTGPLGKLSRSKAQTMSSYLYLYDRFAFPCQHAYHVLTIRISIHAVHHILCGPLSHSFRGYNLTCRYSKTTGKFSGAEGEVLRQLLEGIVRKRGTTLLAA